MLSLALALLVFATSAIPASAQTTDDLFNGDILQEIRIDINPQDWEKLKANPSSNDYYPCNFNWRGIVVENVGIRQRGGSTRSSRKPGLRVDFNRYDDGQKFLGLKSLALDNNVGDASLMKERLTMELFAAMGLPAPREVHARFYVNDRYAGVYTVIESTDKDFLKRTFGENDGYLYEYQEAGGGYHFEYLGSDPALYSPRFFDPKTHEKDPDPAPIEAMIRAMNFSSDTEFPTAMSQYLDLPLFMKHLAVEDFMAETDGILTGMNNFYFYRFEKKSLSQFIVHDKDRTFGGDPTTANRYATPFLVFASKNVLIRRAMSVPQAHDSFFNTLKNAAEVAGASGGWMESEIMRINDQIRSAAYEDTLKGTNGDFDAEVAANLDFARRRSGFTLSQLAEISGERFFAITNPGGSSLTRGDAARPFYAGYAVVESDAPVRNPDGIAVITFRQDGVVVTETSVPASTPVERGLLYAEIDGPVKTGIAIANPSDREASISFFFTDADGRNVGQGNLVIPARGQIARFLDQDPFNSGLARGTFNFESSTPVFVIALRGLTNERSEFILSTLPIVDLTATPGPPVIPVIPHFVDGEGWTTQIILVNPLHQPMQGTIRFFDQQGTTSSPYTIAPGGYYRLQTAGTESTIRSGYAQIVPAGNAPAAFGVFSFRKNGVTVTESSVRAVEAAAVYRTYVEMLDGVQTGIAIANPSSTSITVGLEATLLSGSPAGMSGTLTIPANGHVASFLNEIPGFERMTAPFQGILRISTPASSGIAVAGLRGRTNERGDFLISTIPSVDESVEATTTRLVFPHFVEGSGYTTQFILFSGAAYWTPTGVLRLYDQTGLPISAW